MIVPKSFMMKIVPFLLVLIAVASAEIVVKDQVFCAIDELATLVQKQEFLLNELMQFKKNYQTSNDYFAR